MTMFSRHDMRESVVISLYVKEVTMPTVRTMLLALSSSVILSLAVTTAKADTITIVGKLSSQASTATVVCDFNSQTNTLSFTITNTSAITSPGSTSTITGIG